MIHEDVLAVAEGEIVSVLDQHKHAYRQGQGPPRQSGFIMFLPVVGRIPKIAIRTAQIAKLMDKRIIAHIDEWRLSSRYPAGHYTETIDVIGELETETHVLLLEYDILHSIWSDSVLQPLPRIPRDDDVPLETACHWNRPHRRVLRLHLVGGLPGCVDIDDALH